MWPRTKGDVLEMLRQYLRAGQMAVDVGAACGKMTTVMLDQVGPSGQVVTIEPDLTGRKATTGVLRALGATHQNLTVHECAVGEITGRVLLHRCGSTAASRWHGDGNAARERLVPMVPLDRLVEQADLVKIDTQGSESHILDGASQLLRHCPLWILELWPWGLQTAGRTVWDVLRQFREANLTPCWPNGGPMVDADVDDWIATSLDHHVNMLACR